MMQICAGWPAEAEVDQDIVTFVVAKLSLDECQKNNVKVQNFRAQVKDIRKQEIFL